MALKQANTLAPSNVSATGFALADARHIGGHKVVASLTALYALQDWQLLNPGETDTALALGQQWYVKGIGFYRLTNWANRKTSSGWIKEVDPNNIDTTLFQIVSALPTSGINKNRIYLVASANKDPNGKNIYAEYIYTGDTSATYDATKWEKIGEYTPTVDLSPYMKLEQKGAANGVATLDANGKVTDGQLWDATSSKHGLMSADDKAILDALNGEIAIENLDLTGMVDKFVNGCLPTRLKVTDINTRTHKKVTVGTLDIFTDSMGHQLTEVFTSNYGSTNWFYYLNDIESIPSGHVDGQIIAFHRSYNHSSTSTMEGSMGVKPGTWSKWRGGTDDFTKKAIDLLLNSSIGTEHVVTGNELPLQKDDSGNGYVTVEVMSDAEIDALFT
jgi:hypothetical protein